MQGIGTWCLRRFYHINPNSAIHSLPNFAIHTATPRAADRSFLDSLQLCVQGGTGGKGNPKHGGQGGDGGSVILKGKASKKLRGLEKAYGDKIIKADDGKNAEAARVLGAAAIDRIVDVPVGISVSTRSGRHLGDINAPGETLRVAVGGKGGSLKNGYRGRGPQFQFVNLDLKLVADAGLVGFPNAGKSTLLTRLSNANPRIASYPFTTLQPQLGVMTLDEEERLSLAEGRTPRRVTIADMPGLIEGASKNVGLGHQFLKHIERTKVLLFVIDVNGFQLDSQKLPEPRDAFQSLCLLLKELRLYDASLLSRPALLCVNKVENSSGILALRRFLSQLNDFDASFESAFSSSSSSSSSSSEELAQKMEISRPPRFRGIHAISAEKRINLQPVVRNLFEMVLEERERSEPVEVDAPEDLDSAQLYENETSAVDEEGTASRELYETVNDAFRKRTSAR